MCIRDSNRPKVKPVCLALLWSFSFQVKGFYKPISVSLVFTSLFLTHMIAYVLAGMKEKEISLKRVFRPVKGRNDQIPAAPKPSVHTRASLRIHLFKNISYLWVILPHAGSVRLLDPTG